MLGRNKTRIKYFCTNSKLMSKIKIGLVQMSCSNDKESNLAKAIAGIRSAHQQGAQIICLQELFTSLYFCDEEDYDNFKLAETIPGPSTETLGKIAGELNVVIIASLFEKRAQGLYHNTTAVLDADGSYLGKYRKMHIPDDPNFYEKFYFTPGDLGYKVFKTKYATLGVLICWDQWYPEAARLTALKGAEVLFYPTAIGWHPDEKEQYGENQYGAWMNVMKGHAVANGIYVAAANRIGLEQYVPNTAGIEFWGASFIAGPQGEILAQASHDKEEILIAEVDLDLQENVRQNWPFFRDRRIDAYGDITNRALEE